MTIDKETEPFFKEILRNDVEEIYFAQWIDKINSHHHLDRRLFLVSDSALILCSPKPFSKVPQRKKSFHWLDLRGIDSVNPTTFTYYFRKKENPETDVSITFTSEEHAQSLFSSTCIHVVSMLSPDEYPTVKSIPNFSFANYTPFVLGSYIRLKASILYDAALDGDDVTLLKTYVEFIKSGNSLMNIGIFIDTEHIGKIIDSLNVVPHVKTVEFPYSPVNESHWKELKYILKYSKHIRRIVTGEKLDGFVEEIQDLKKEDLRANIVSISISLSRFTEKDLNVVYSLFSLGIPEFTIMNLTFTTQTFSFLEKLTRVPTLTTLYIDQTENIPFSRVIKIMSKIENIGFTRCALELSTTFDSICKLTDCQTKSINLSGNQFTNPLTKISLQLPVSIEKLVLNSVDFRGVAAQVFLSFMIRQIRESPNITLSISDMTMEEDMWKSLFRFMSRHANKDKNQYPFRAIYWDDNEMNYPAFSFFGQRSDLSTFSMNGSINYTDEYTIQYLLAFIACAKSCTELRIGGTLKRSLSPETLESVIGAFKNDRRVIKRIDISKHRYRPKTFLLLSNILVENQVIEYIDFTNNGITDPDVWRSFFGRLLKRGRPLTFPIPQAEFSEMLNRQEITVDELHDFMAKIRKIQEGDSSIEVPHEALFPIAQNSLATVNINDNNNKNIKCKGDILDKSTAKLDGWKVVAEPVPPIDNKELEECFEAEFGLMALVEAIKPSKNQPATAAAEGASPPNDTTLMGGQAI